MNSPVGVPFSLRTAATSLGGALHPQCSEFSLITSVGIDSRHIEPGALFVPLPGRFTDGHDFIMQALENGAVLSLVSEHRAEHVFTELPRELHQRLLIVDDALSALQRLSRWYIDGREHLVKIAITGSNGKTTTKEIIASILSREYSIFKTPGNYNSVIGVPIAAFGITDDHRYGVFELAMSERGEMAVLSRLVLPDVGVLTNIGVAHIGNIGSQQGIAEEKKAIFSSFSGRQRAFLPEDEPYYDYLAESIQGQVIPFGMHHTPGIQGVDDLGLDGVRVRWSNREMVFPLPGMHNLQNVLASISVAVELGASPESIIQGVEGVEPPFGRGQILRGEVTIIQDCYNANPDSMRSALEFFRAVPWKGRKIAVLGDMLELGENSPGEHRRLLQSAVGFDHLYLVGEAFIKAAGEDSTVRENPGAFSTGPNTREIISDVMDYLVSGDLVLLKGSRGIGLEAISERIQHAPQFGGTRC